MIIYKQLFYISFVVAAIISSYTEKQDNTRDLSSLFNGISLQTNINGQVWDSIETHVFTGSGISATESIIFNLSGKQGSQKGHTVVSFYFFMDSSNIVSKHVRSCYLTPKNQSNSICNTNRIDPMTGDSLCITQTYYTKENVSNSFYTNLKDQLLEYAHWTETAGNINAINLSIQYYPAQGEPISLNRVNAVDEKIYNLIDQVVKI